MKRNACIVGVLGIFTVLAAAFAADPTTDAPKRPRILGISHVALWVKDLDASRAFYKDYLGFGEPYSLPKVDDPSKIHLTFIKINDDQVIELFPETQPATDRFYHISLIVDDAEAMRVYLESRGVKVPAKVATGRIGNHNFGIVDPDGHNVEIVQYMPGGWTALNKGKFMPDTRVSTRMKHLGILVGSVEKSKAFYGDVLGFTETWRGSRDSKTLSWVNLKVPDGDDYLEFMLYDTLPDPDKRGVAHHICLEVDDVNKVLETVKTRTLPPGCRAPSEIRVGVNGKRQLNFYDPDGTRVEVMEPRTANGQPTPPSTAPAPRP